MTQHILGLLLALAILGAQGCSKQNDASAPPPAPSPAAVAIDPPKAAPAVQPDYPKAGRDVLILEARNKLARELMGKGVIG